jgi:hypothetical protein
MGRTPLHRGRGRSRPSAAVSDAERLATAKRLVRRYPGVIGVDWGYVYEDGVRTGEIGIRYHVPRKLPLRKIPTEDRLPKEIERVRVDVLEGGFIPHRADPFSAAAVLQPGLSIGNVPRQSDGTLGLFAKDRRDGTLCVLSNWHVLCGGLAARAGDMISQPGPLFSGPNPARQIAELRRWVSPERQYDAAIAGILPGIQRNDALLDGGVTIAGASEPQVGMHVVKCGAASIFTHALVDAIHGSYQVPYQAFGESTRWMLGIRLVPDANFQDRHVSLPGDSGSIWIEAASGKAVALNFAGEDDVGPLNEYALAHPISDVCALLEIEVAGSS